MKKSFSIFLMLVFTLTLTSCLKKEQQDTKKSTDLIELTYYKMYDDEDVLASLITDWSLNNSYNANVIVNYKQFTDYDEYLRTILNEMAEGEGPDIFSMPSTWYLSNYKKVYPLPDSFAPENERITDIFREMFVDVAAQDLIRPDSEGIEKVYALPMTVDTLALYYNKDHFEDRIPSQGRPSKTWDGIKEDVLLLNRYDEEDDDFRVSGIAMGRGDNISRGVDILYLLFTQFGVAFYNENISEAIFAQRQDGLKYLGLEALDLITSFADSDMKHYSWNEEVVDDDSDGKEELAFAKGDLSMFIGFSYSYENVLNYISLLENAGDDAISKNDIYVSQIPQLEDPDDSNTTRVTYSSYFAETVSRNCENPDLAWDLLVYLTQEDSLNEYFEKTKKPTSRRDMIEDQQKESIYGVFASQIGFAESFPIFDYYTYKDLFGNLLDSSSLSSNNKGGLVSAQQAITSLLPVEGLLPAIQPKEDDEEDDD